MRSRRVGHEDRIESTVCSLILAKRYIIYFSKYIDSIFIEAAAAATSLQSCPTLRPYRQQPTRLPRWPNGKESSCQCRRLRRRRSDPWVEEMHWRRTRQPTLVFLLENHMDRGAWQATVHKVAESEAVVESCLSLCEPVDCSTPGFLFLTISQSLPKFMFMPSSHLIL